MITEKSQKQAKIFNVGLNSTSSSKVLRAVRDSILKAGNKRPLLISTPNPEIVLMAKKDDRLRKIINSFDFSIPDGIGLAAASKYLSLKSPKNIILRFSINFFEGLWVGFSLLFNRDWIYESLNIIKGRVLFMDLLKLANKKKWRVFLLGGGGAPKEAAMEIQKSYKRVSIKAIDAPKLNLEGKTIARRDIKIEKDIIRYINDFKPHLLFVGITPPKQEKWIARNVSKLNSQVIMTVGGTFDYVGNKYPLPPAWMERLGLEWLWRLVSQPNPKRIKRVLTAFPIFPLKVFWYKLSQK
jgi:N-acetylglucosaminyldiphosphoundecaprenol N-acetyl-beta-D-mannosaminyltransferase